MSPESIARVDAWLAKNDAGADTPIGRRIPLWRSLVWARGVAAKSTLGDATAFEDALAGLLTSLVRHAYNCPLAHVRCLGPQSWQVWTVDPRTGKWVLVGDDYTELESLCQALESAPGENDPCSAEQI